MPLRKVILMILRKAQYFLQCCKDKTSSRAIELIAEAQAIIMENKQFPAALSINERKTISFILEEQKNKKPSRWLERQQYLSFYKDVTSLH